MCIHKISNFVCFKSRNLENNVQNFVCFKSWNLENLPNANLCLSHSRNAWSGACSNLCFLHHSKPLSDYYRCQSRTFPLPISRSRVLMRPGFERWPLAQQSSTLTAFDVRRTHTIRVASFWMLCDFRVCASSWTGWPLASISCVSFESRWLSEVPRVDSLRSGLNISRQSVQ